LLTAARQDLRIGNATHAWKKFGHPCYTRNLTCLKRYTSQHGHSEEAIKPDSLQTICLTRSVVPKVGGEKFYGGGEAEMGDWGAVKQKWAVGGR